MRTMLAALVLASMVPGVLLATYFVLSAHFQRTEAASREVIATARSVAANLDRDLASIEAALQVLSLSPSLAQGNLAAFHQEASDALPFQNLTNYVLIDTQGAQHMNTLRPPDAALPTNTGGAPWQEVFKRDRRVLSDVFMGPLINQPIMAMVVPVHKRDGGPPVYALGAGIVPERIAAVLVTAGTLEEKARALIDAANDSGGRDNISVILAAAKSKPVRKGLLSRMLGQ